MRGLRSLGENPALAVSGNRREALGDVGPPVEDHRVDPGADRALRRAGIVAAVKNRFELCGRHGLARRIDDGLEPSRPGGDAGLGSAGDDDGTAGLGRGGCRGDGLCQRVNDKDWRASRTACGPAGGLPGGRRDVSPCARLRRC